MSPSPVSVGTRQTDCPAGWAARSSRHTSLTPVPVGPRNPAGRRETLSLELLSRRVSPALTAVPLMLRHVSSHRSCTCSHSLPVEGRRANDLGHLFRWLGDGVRGTDDSVEQAPEVSLPELPVPPIGEPRIVSAEWGRAYRVRERSVRASVSRRLRSYGSSPPSSRPTAHRRAVDPGQNRPDDPRGTRLFMRTREDGAMDGAVVGLVLGSLIGAIGPC